MDLMALAMHTAMQKVQIDEKDVAQIKKLIKELSEMPGKINLLLENQARIEKRIDYLINKEASTWKK